MTPPRAPKAPPAPSWLTGRADAVPAERKGKAEGEVHLLAGGR